MTTSLNREKLLRIALLLRPALATGDYIPAQQHICFKGKYATAYNDISAIAARTTLGDLERCLPGELLIRALQSFNTEDITIKEKEKEVTLSSGRSNLKLPTLGVDDFPLKWPEAGDGVEVGITPPIIRGIERCLMSVGNDPTHPEQMGVTLDAVDGEAVLFSSDNWSISRYETGERVRLDGGAIILPTFFCQQLVALAKAYGEGDKPILLTACEGALIAEFGDEYRLLTKTLVDREPADFPAMLKKHLKVKNLKKDLVEIPDAFDAALQRSLLVLQNEDDKAMKVEITNNGFRMLSEGMGEADDQMKCEDEPSFDSPEELHLDPQLVARGAKACALMGFLPKALVLADKEARFVHLVAYCAAKKQ